MTGRPHHWSFRCYVAAVAGGGALLLLVFAARGGLHAMLYAPAAFWLLALLFAVALLLGWGPGPTVLAVAGCCAASDLLQRKPIKKAPFNAAQYVLALTAAGGILQVIGGTRFSLRWFLAFALAALVYSLVNRALIAVVIGLDQGVPAAVV